MRHVNFSLILVFLTCGCQKTEEETRDLDEMVMEENMLDTFQEPAENPQEIFIKEPAAH